MRLSDAIWRWRSWSTLVQVMACCLMAPRHYLNQCWLIISKVLWHSSEDIIIRRFGDTKIEDDIFKITWRSPRGQWVKYNQARVDMLHMVHKLLEGIKTTTPVQLGHRYGVRTTNTRALWDSKGCHRDESFITCGDIKSCWYDNP